VSLGDEIVVRVDDIDPTGKVSLTPIRDGDESEAPAHDTSPLPAAVGAATVNFEDAFDAEIRQTFGDLGPETVAADTRGGEPRGDRGDRGEGRGDRGRGSGPRRRGR
jgi:polyribonucleotide nucleotidyltransferase